MLLEKHSSGLTLEQSIEVDLEVTDTDLQIMRDMKGSSQNIIARASHKYSNIGSMFTNVANWDLDLMSSGQRITYRIVNGGLASDGTQQASLYQEFLSTFEIDSLMRDEFGFAPLRKPLLYLPVMRSSQGFSSRIGLAGYQPWEQRRQGEATNSRSPNSAIIAEAIGSIALKYRLLQETDNVSARTAFKSDPALVQLNRVLSDLGYTWDLVTVSPQRNEYDIRLTKQGSSFLVGASSSGERELLTYLFAIYALNIRDALIIIDEPELHLHPKWQTVLLSMFIRLAQSTGNQFLMATHSPTFVSPDSIQYVSRVYTKEQKSQIVRLRPTSLPDPRHLFNCVNSQNNEKVFFADAVVLVEGLSDRMVFEELLRRRSKLKPTRNVIEIVSVGGKGMFEPYQKLLGSSEIRHFVIADRDYIEQVAPSDIASLFTVDDSEVKTDVLQNPESLDGSALVRAIDRAVESGSWDEAQEVWAYIKGRRRRLRSDLDLPNQERLDQFIDSLASTGLFILKKGSIESYLPNGYRGKRIDKLVELVAKEEMIEMLPNEAVEIHGILDRIIAEVEAN